jgi:hypothetical protein
VLSDDALCNGPSKRNHVKYQVSTNFEISSTLLILLDLRKSLQRITQSLAICFFFDRQTRRRQGALAGFERALLIFEDQNPTINFPRDM